MQRDDFILQMGNWDPETPRLNLTWRGTAGLQKESLQPVFHAYNLIFLEADDSGNVPYISMLKKYEHVKTVTTKSKQWQASKATNQLASASTGLKSQQKAITQILMFLKHI